MAGSKGSRGELYPPLEETWGGGVRRLTSAAARSFALVAAVAIATFAGTVAAQAPAPPPEPAVAPLIGDRYANDANGDRLDDRLLARALEAKTLWDKAATEAEKANARKQLEQPVAVDLVFKQQITQQQIDDFLAAGGEIDYLYKAVSYGWTGRLPLGAVAQLPARLGPSLVLVEQPQPVELHLDIASNTGRVRPIWASGFAGNPAGFDGHSSITIGIVDSGVDESHTDLNGRRVFWTDVTTDAEPNPRDVVQHGTHVAGIAAGTGAAGGSAAAPLLFTDSGDLTGVGSGSFYSSPVTLPNGATTFSSTATWLGGGTGQLAGAYRAVGSTGSFTGLSALASGASPLSEINSFTASTANQYTAALLSNGSMSNYTVVNSIINYPGSGDGFNRFRGAAPACSWAGAKVFDNTGSGFSNWTGAGIDALVNNRIAHDIKVMNLSLGTVGDPGLTPANRQRLNTAVNNGIVVVSSAGNDGRKSTAAERETDDPGRAAMCLTVAAANDVNELTDYSSHGVASPDVSVAGQEEDYKPDITAPGGSNYYSDIMSVDSNSADGETVSISDQRANDYYNIHGTSMASPFVAGCAALVIDAMEQQGVTWDFTSAQYSLYVKMVLCATATETNTNREISFGFNPTLERDTAGPGGFPVGKDQFEGYGMVNPDAAVEAVTLTHTLGATDVETLGGAPASRRAWARNVSLTAAVDFSTTLTNPAGADYDLYLYDDTPSTNGTPVILASSTTAGNGGIESIFYTPPANDDAIVVVKRVSGSGQFSLSSHSPTVAPTVLSVVRDAPSPINATTVTWTVTFSEAVSGVDTTDFNLVTTGVTGASVGAVSGGATSYTVSANTGSGEGLMRLDVIDNDSIVNGGSTPLGGTGAGNGDFRTGEMYLIDRTAPTLSGIRLADDDRANSPSLGFTNNATVDVILQGISGAPSEMWLSESSTFATGGWATFQSPTSFTFATTTEEVKTVYAMLRDAADNRVGDAGNISDQIELDTTRPQVDPVATTPDPNQPWVDITYDAVVVFGVLVPGNYVITGTGSPTVQNVVHQTGNTFRLITDAQAIGDPYVVTVSNVADRAGNLIDPAHDEASWTGVPVEVSEFELD